MTTERAHFVFCFQDVGFRYDWHRDEFEAAQWYIQTAANEQWVLQENGGPNDFNDPVVTTIKSLAQLEADFRSDIATPPEAFDIVFEKLKVLMTTGGWRFVGGAYSLGEGFDEIDLEVVLERQSER